MRALADLKHALEGTPMNNPEFVYVTYIKTTPEKLWQALTDSTFTRRYWGVELESDWKVGSPVLTQAVPGGEIRDLDQVGSRVAAAPATVLQLAQLPARAC